MRKLSSFSKTTLASFVVILCSGTCHHSAARSPIPGAANPKQQITIVASHAASKAELQLTKQDEDPGKRVLKPG
jgi:hypothetical protein